MKISVCGKGGSGKSTIVTLLAQELVRRGREILIIDADESNYGLHRHLGMEKPEDFMEYVGGKPAFVQNRGENPKEFMEQYFKGTWMIRDIPGRYYTEKDGIRLMSSGKIQEAGEGCACPFNAVLKTFVEHLSLEEGQVAIFDMEAGIEHFGRGIDDDMNVILMVCDPSYESIQLAEKITSIAEKIQKPVYYILNKVEGDMEKILRKKISRPENILCIIPVNKEIQAEGLSGEKVTVSVPEIGKIADKVID